MTLSELRRYVLRVQQRDKDLLFAEHAQMAVSAWRVGEVSTKDLVDLVFLLFRSDIYGAAPAARQIVEQVGFEVSPVLTYNYAIDLLQGNGGPRDERRASQLIHVLIGQDIGDDLKKDVLQMAGEIYMYGIGRAPEFDAALAYYEKAAELGNCLAAFNLGLYWQGKLPGMPRPKTIDHAKSIMYYSIGKRKDKQCTTNLGIILAGQAEAAVRLEGLKLLEWSKERGDPIATDALLVFTDTYLADKNYKQRHAAK